MQPVHRALILSTDDTVEYVFKGSEPTAASFLGLVSKSVLGKRGIKSLYDMSEDHTASGLRVKITHTFAADGVAAPMFISICGLTDNELPSHTCPSGILVMELDGLNVGEGGKTKGRVVFIRNDKDKQTDKVCCRFYRDHVLIPFIQYQRRMSCAWEKGAPIEESMRAVSWFDGNSAQIAAITEEESLAILKEHKVFANRESAARSAVEQAADLHLVSKFSTHCSGQTQCLIFIKKNHRPKYRVMDGFKRMRDEGGLRLTSLKLNALIDFMSILPQVSIRATARNLIVGGFESNGIIMEEKKYHSRFALPDFERMINTLSRPGNRDVMNSEWDLCKATLPELLKLQVQTGHVEEAE